MAPKHNAAIKPITGIRLREVLDSLVDEVCAIDRRGIILYTNPAVEAWGYQPQEMIGKTVLDFVVGEDRARSKQVIDKISKGDELAFFINRIRKKDGSARDMEWHNTRGDSDAIFGIARNTTGNDYLVTQTNGDKLFPVDRNIPEVLERITDGFFAVDHDFVVTYWNNKSEVLLGTAREHILGKKLWDVYTEGIGSFIYKQHQKAMEEHISQEYEAYYEPLKMWFRINTYPSANGLSILFKDISDAKKQHEESQKGIRQRQKMLTATIIKAEERVRTEIGKELHDNINQILTTVKLYVEIALHEEIPNKDMLGKSLEHLNHCIQEIRSLSKVISAPWIESISIKESMSDLLDTLKATKELRTSLSTSGLQGKKIDQEIHIALYRIAQEHLTNIINHSAASTVNITISATLSNIIMHIYDDGLGFDLKAKRKGIGIINMTSRAEALNGTLVINTSPGKGCLLIVTLPLHREELH